MHSVALAVIDGDPVAIHFGDAIRAARIERRELVLWDLADLAKHLGGAGLVETNVRVDDADRIEHSRHAESSDLAGKNRLRPGRLHEALCRQVVDLVRSML